MILNRQILVKIHLGLHAGTLICMNKKSYKTKEGLEIVQIRTVQRNTQGCIQNHCITSHAVKENK